jgi:hypothetical protein
MITSLKAKPFHAFTAFANRYKEISPYPFGSLVCEQDGRPALTARPMGDLAILICFPDRERSKTLWPPAAPFWEPALRLELLQLSMAMRDWARNFRDYKGVPHWRVIDAGLETMRAWLDEPELASSNQWWGISEVIQSGRQLPTGELNLKIRFWNPLKETEEDFNKRIRAATDDVKRWAKNQIQQSKKLLVSFDTKRNPEHFHWAVLRIVRELTYPQIAEWWANLKPNNTDALDEGTVRKGVHAVLKTLQLLDLNVKRT